jgi:hypothetical protein
LVLLFPHLSSTTLLPFFIFTPLPSHILSITLVLFRFLLLSLFHLLSYCGLLLSLLLLLPTSPTTVATTTTY